VDCRQRLRLLPNYFGLVGVGCRGSGDIMCAIVCVRNSAMVAAARGSNTQREGCRRSVSTDVQRYHRSETTHRGRDRQRFDDTSQQK